MFFHFEKSLQKTEDRTKYYIFCACFTIPKKGILWKMIILGITASAANEKQRHPNTVRKQPRLFQIKRVRPNDLV
ncbi:hypothetical protein HMPREF9554_01718 [Treponema phagedenis F0421]|nr:hypothetical protein HMPREF9554_01718 [Treponema phagedenis F0421]